ncbi:hypothetical protein HDV00_002593 [Rhizophlyctis rosea]|nr:hypothetical protein HDV00_002593 [Rhizophlyctis rosea]
MTLHTIELTNKQLRGWTTGDKYTVRISRDKVNLSGLEAEERVAVGETLQKVFAKAGWEVEDVKWYSGPTTFGSAATCVDCELVFVRGVDKPLESVRVYTEEMQTALAMMGGNGQF